MRTPDHIRARGDISYRHVYGCPSSRTGQRKCLSCGRAKPPVRRKREVLLMSLIKGWRLVAYPLSYRVERLFYNHYTNNPQWTEVQRLPRTRNQWVDEELDCAASMFNRALAKAIQEKQAHYQSYYNQPPKADLHGEYAAIEARDQLKTVRERLTYCKRILLPPIWWQRTLNNEPAWRMMCRGWLTTQLDGVQLIWKVYQREVYHARRERTISISQLCRALCGGARRFIYKGAGD